MEFDEKHIKNGDVGAECLNSSMSLLFTRMDIECTQSASNSASAAKE